MMMYGDFHVATPFLKKDKGGKKSVHSVEQRELAGDIRMQDLEGTTRILGSVPGHHPSERIGYHGLHFLEKAVLSVRPDSSDHGIFAYMAQQEFEILGLGLQVGVDIADIFRKGIVDPRFQCCSETVVPVE